MRSNVQVTFTNGTPTSEVGVLLFLEEDDNQDPLEAYREQYLATHGSYPSFSTAKDRKKYADLLLQSLIASYTRVVRVYGVSQGNCSLIGIRTGSTPAQKGGMVSEITTEDQTLQGVSGLTVKFPVKRIVSVEMTLRDSQGKPYYTWPVVTPSGDVMFDREVFGYVHITYEHQYFKVEVTTTKKEALDKPNAMLLVKTANAPLASIDVRFPDIKDDNGISPDEKDDGWRITITTIKPNMYPDFWESEDAQTVLKGEVFTEVSRTVDVVVIEGIEIERARTVSLVSETGADLKLIFTATPQGGTL